MAVDSTLPQSPKPVVYHSPTDSLAPSRPRATSGRKSSNNGAALPASIEVPRTSPHTGAQDSDIFSLNPSHLARWDICQLLRERLPANLQVALTNMQRAGAAVLTGYERAEQHSGGLDMGSNEAPEDEMLVQLDESLSNLPRVPKLRADSSACSEMSSSAIVSSPSSGSRSPSASQPGLAMSPISPICLTPTDPFPLLNRVRERSFSTPLEPQNAKYATEISQLRTESLPRLLHTARKVDTEWSEVRRTGLLSSIDANDFENWWADKKCTIDSLNESIRRLSDSIGLSPNGMGWTAP